MEFILINENKIKVMLSPCDLEEFDIEAEELDYTNTDTKRVFWDILSRAKHSTGFDTDGQRVLVQLYPSRHGGCEIFVTKIANEENEEQNLTNGADEPLICEKITVKSKHEKNKAQKKHHAAYGFENLSELISVCKRLSNLGYKGESSAYIGENSRFYLFISEPDTRSYSPLHSYSFISEFGNEENREKAKIYLLEHGKEICRTNAVITLSKL